MLGSVGPPVIQTHGLSKAYRGVEALKGLDLAVPRHSIFGFLGPNGAGKSTAIKLLLGLARPTGGEGRVFGLDIVRDSVEIRKRIGYLAQDPRYYERLTARETLRFVAGFFYAGPREAVEHRIDETLALVGLDDRADRPTKGFSGGERQRLGIAQAYVNHPDLLILDEPAAALDPMGRRDVLEVMARLRERTTIFYSTHLLEDVQRVSDMVAILNRGKLVVQAPIADLLAGTGGATYALALKGDTEHARHVVAGQPWVSSVDVVRRNGTTEWRVGVTDERAAEAELLPLVLAGGATVAEFGRRTANLEEVFIDLVEGGNRGR